MLGYGRLRVAPWHHLALPAPRARATPHALPPRAFPAASTQHRVLFSSPFSKVFGAAAGAGTTDGLLGALSGSLDEDAAGAVQECERLKAEALASPAKVVVGLDDMSNALCKVADALELLRSVHPNAAIAAKATEVHHRLSTYIFALNADTNLYDCVKRAVEKGAESGAFATLPEEIRRLGTSMVREFESGGIHLAPELAKQLQSLQARELTLSTQFTNALAEPHDVCVVPTAAFNRLPISLQSFVTSHAVRLPRALHSRGERGIAVPTTEEVYSTLVHHAKEPQLREAVYRAHHSSMKGNIGVLADLLKTRHSIANILGHDSHAHVTVGNMMCKRPQTVRALLASVSDVVMSTAQDEMRALEMLAPATDTPLPLQPWDVPFLSYRYQQLEGKPVGTEMSDYLSVGNSLRALNAIVRVLFGVEMVEVVDRPAAEVWHPSVQKLVFRSSTDREIDRTAQPPNLPTITHAQWLAHEEQFLGILYLDLFAREGKYANSAHFTVRCGRYPDHAPPQTPVVALALNFSSATNSLTLSDVETLFHEFGHALHSLLSHTRTQHLSGTRAPLDFVEIPSHLFEYLAWDERIMALYARHVTTGQPPSPTLTHSVVFNKRLLRGLALQHQVFLAAVDFELHSRDPNECEVSDVVREMCEKHTLTRHVPGTHWETRFGHLVWYGGGYYSYLWCRVVAANIWQRHFKDDPLSPKAGDVLYHKLLRHGGARDPDAVVADILEGEEPSLALWREYESI